MFSNAIRPSSTHDGLKRSTLRQHPKESQVRALPAQILIAHPSQLVSSNEPALVETTSDVVRISSRTGTPRRGQKNQRQCLPLSPTYS